MSGAGKADTGHKGHDHCAGSLPRDGTRRLCGLMAVAFGPARGIAYPVSALRRRRGRVSAGATIGFRVDHRSTVRAPNRIVPVSRRPPAPAVCAQRCAQTEFAHSRSSRSGGSCRFRLSVDGWGWRRRASRAPLTGVELGEESKRWRVRQEIRDENPSVETIP